MISVWKILSGGKKVKETENANIMKEFTSWETKRRDKS
jgi:hypothetical protein